MPGRRLQLGEVEEQHGEARRRRQQLEAVGGHLEVLGAGDGAGDPQRHRLAVDGGGDGVAGFDVTGLGEVPLDEHVTRRLPGGTVDDLEGVEWLGTDRSADEAGPDAVALTDGETGVDDEPPLGGRDALTVGDLVDGGGVGRAQLVPGVSEAELLEGAGLGRVEVEVGADGGDKGGDAEREQPDQGSGLRA